MVHINTASDRGLGEFLALLHATAPTGLVFSTSSYDASNRSDDQFYPTDDSGRSDAAGHVLRYAGSGRQIESYIRVTVMRSRPTKGRGTAADTLCTTALWVDCDTYKVGRSNDEFLTHLLNLPNPPSMVVQTGKGTHAYWLLNAPLFDAERIQRLNRRLMNQFRPWGADACWSADHLMRLPGSLNWKTDPPTPAELVYAGDRYYDADLFEEGDDDSNERVEDRTIDSEPLPTGFLQEIQQKSPRLYQRIYSEESARQAGAMCVDDGRVDRSENDWYIVTHLLGLEYTAGVCLSVLTHPTWFSGDKVRTTRNYGYATSTVLSAVRIMQETHPSTYFDGSRFSPVKMADRLLEEYSFSYAAQTLYRYDEGVFKRDGGDFVESQVLLRLRKSNWTPSRGMDVKRAVELQTSIQADSVGRHNGLINVLNGMVRLSDGALTDHAPAYQSLAQLPVWFDPTAPTVAVDNVVEQILRDENAIAAYWEFVGYCLLPHCEYKKALLLVGTTHTGKSTLFRIVEALLGYQNIATVDLLGLSEHQFAIGTLFGKLANVCADISTTIALTRSERVKMLSAGDPVTAEQKYKDPYTFRNRAKLLFSANAFPAIQRPDSAILGRFLVIPCDNQFLIGENGTNPHIARDILTPRNLSGVLNRALEGARRLEEQGTFTQSQLIQRATEQFHIESDTVFSFWWNATDLDGETRLPKTQTYDLYRAYTQASGNQPVSLGQFYRRTKEAFQMLGLTEYEGRKGEPFCYKGRKVVWHQQEVIVMQGSPN
jgi:P4 family phage/plasmid primase-like protien